MVEGTPKGRDRKKPRRDVRCRSGGRDPGRSPSLSLSSGHQLLLSSLARRRPGDAFPSLARLQSRPYSLASRVKPSSLARRREGPRRREGEVGGRCLGTCRRTASEVLLRLDPPEICRMARLSRTFRGAASGDSVWEAKLPRNYARLLAAAASDEEGCQAATVLEAEAIPKKGGVRAALPAEPLRRRHQGVLARQGWWRYLHVNLFKGAFNNGH